MILCLEVEDRYDISTLFTWVVLSSMICFIIQ